MPTSFFPETTPRADAGAPLPAVRHRRLTLDATGEPLRYFPITVEAQQAGYRAAANVMVDSGAFTLYLRPTVAELRALALMLTATADEIEMAAAAARAATTAAAHREAA